MSRLKDVFGMKKEIEKKVVQFADKISTMRADIYSNTKEVAMIKYANVELELRLSNLEEMVKILTRKPG